jgi:hypothetical protein
MRDASTPPPTCIYAPSDDHMSGRCEAVARYIVLGPPLVYTLMPTAVWLEGENPQSQTVRKRGDPLYCRTHAYQVCGLVEGKAGGGDPPLGRTSTERGGHGEVLCLQEIAR